MPDPRLDPLTDSDDLLDMAADVLDHDDALRVVRRLRQRFPCIAHERWYCQHYSLEGTVRRYD